MRKKPGDEAFRVSFKFPRRGWDQSLSDFNIFSSVETLSGYSCLLLYLHDVKEPSVSRNMGSAFLMFRWSRQLNTDG